MKKGFTLIEMLTTLSIMSVLILWASYDFYKFNDVLYSSNISYVDNTLLAFLDNAKIYCADAKLNGVVIFDFEKNKVELQVKGNVVTKYYLSKGFTFYSINSTNGRNIAINSNGMTANACTIIYKDSRGSCHKITISVGTNHVEVYD